MISIAAGTRSLTRPEILSTSTVPPRSPAWPRSALGSLPVTVLTASEHSYPGLAPGGQARLQRGLGRRPGPLGLALIGLRTDPSRPDEPLHPARPARRRHRTESVGCSRDLHRSLHERHHHHEEPRPHHHHHRRRPLAASACSQSPSDTSSLPTTSDVQRIIDDRVQSGRSTGIVAGIVLPDGTTRVAGSGDDGGRPLDGDSVFEIGSITKTFTATLLTVMVHNDEVDLDDPVASLLPEGTSVPSQRWSPDHP